MHISFIHPFDLAFIKTRINEIVKVDQGSYNPLIDVPNSTLDEPDFVEYMSGCGNQWFVNNHFIIYDGSRDGLMGLSSLLRLISEKVEFRENNTIVLIHKKQEVVLLVDEFKSSCDLPFYFNTRKHMDGKEIYDRIHHRSYIVDPDVLSKSTEEILAADKTVESKKRDNFNAFKSRWTSLFYSPKKEEQDLFSECD